MSRAGRPNGFRALVSVSNTQINASNILGVSPLEFVIKIIGGKWRSAVIYIVADGPKRFGNLEKLILSISQRILTFDLKKREKAGKRAEQVPDVPTFRKNAAAFVYQMRAGAIASADGDDNSEFRL
jgi:DNA-binding HxlR family transcriptional regulator